MAPAGFEQQPVVRLVKFFADPYDNRVATARSCYSPKVLTEEDVRADERARELRDRIADSTYLAGHHTTLQHATFQFILERVSRQFIWSFLHSHPYYNSEQVSQRYVPVKRGMFLVPALPEAERRIYLETIDLQMEAYERLAEILHPVMEAEYYRIYPARQKEKEKWRLAIRRKLREVARYILPLATYAHLYHTVNGLTLHRYARLCCQMDVPAEQRAVVEKMIEEVRRIDPLFLRNIEDPVPLEETLEYSCFKDFGKGSRPEVTSAFLKEFDEDLKGRTSKLVDYKPRGARLMADAVRAVLGLPRDAIGDAEAIDRVLNPAKNPYLSEALTLTTASKLTRSMVHPHFTFRKKLSHSADSQDQRHRMTPASRPVLAAHFRPETVDIVLPAATGNHDEARSYFLETCGRIWGNITRLLNAGVSEERALYLLPNAFPIRFDESGDLLNLHHKWTSRLCYTAQEEIWRMSLDEVRQVSEIHPEIGARLRAPCTLRCEARVKPFCPEGNRFCGVPVWKYDLDRYERPIF